MIDITAAQLEEIFDRKFQPLYERMDSLEQKIDNLELRVCSLERKVDSLDRKVNSLETRMDENFALIYQLFDRRVNKVETNYLSKRETYKLVPQ